MRLRLGEAKPRDINETIHIIQSNIAHDPKSTLKGDNQQLREIKNLKRNSNIPTQSYASNPYGYNPDRSFHQNYRPNNNSFRSRGSPNQTNLNNARHNYPKNPRPTPFRPQRRGNYP